MTPSTDTNPSTDTEPSTDTNPSTDTDVTDSDNSYDIDDIVEGTYPENMKLNVKRGRKNDIQLFLAADNADLVESVNYKILSGKKKIKVVSCDIYEDGGDTFADAEIKGAKKGNAKVKLILTLNDGEEFEAVFNIKVK